MMKPAIIVLATILLVAALFVSEAEAYGGGGFDGQAGRSRDDTFIGVSGRGQFGQPQRHARQHLESYPSYLPYGSCFSLWYTVPGYTSPMDCPPGT
jgi:hypothetical protein